MTSADTGLPGRSCPLDYRYAPADLRVAPSPALSGLEVLYVVGGLYGNALALAQVLRLFAQESGAKALVFNGDFHWFDADPALFTAVQAEVLQHHATRGNVETELARPSALGDAGCGCAYPEWVGQEVVERSNRIHARLHRAATHEQRQALAALPMWLRASVGPMQLAIVHGDATSLAGWGFAQEHWHQASQREAVRGWLVQAGVDAFACSHTCLPLFGELRLPGRPHTGWVLNNGAAGMPNFRGDSAGLFTRIALHPARGMVGQARRLSAVWPGGADAERGVHLEAVAIEVDAAQMQAQFVAQWPEGSDAHASYFSRIAQGPDYRPEQVIRQEN
jgi:hypothetical protein